MRTQVRSQERGICGGGGGKEGVVLEEKSSRTAHKELHFRPVILVQGRVNALSVAWISVCALCPGEVWFQTSSI